MNLSKIIGTLAVIGMIAVFYNNYKKESKPNLKIK